MQARKSMVLLIVVSVLLISVIPPGFAEIFVASNGTGPYVDRVVYLNIYGNDQQVLALLNDGIDLIGTQIDPAYLPQLEADLDINISLILRNGYGQLTINCAKYPLNITAFRRAFAYAFNKTQVVEQVWSNYALLHDSPISAPSPFCIEGTLPYNYYSADISVGNSILNAAGFNDIDADGWREAPDGNDFDIRVEVPSSFTMGIETGTIAVEALQALAIDASLVISDFHEYMSRVNYHADFDIVFYELGYPDFNPTFLETQYGGNYYMVDYFNAPNFQNATCDFLISQMLTSNSYEDAFDAVASLQEILIYECPRVIAYDNFDFAAYRTDIFEDHVIDISENIRCFWTNLKVKRSASAGGPFGGTFRISLPLAMDSFNFMTTTSASTLNVLENTEVSLLKRSPSGGALPWLAESYLVETHAENPSVPVGHTRFTFDLVNNATWSDGQQVDALDVAYALNYYIDSVAYGNPTGLRLGNIVAAYASAQFQAVIEFSTESYWNLDNIAFLNIIPQHIFETIGLAGWNTWNPIFSVDPFVTAGPFNVTGFIPGEFVELTNFPGFIYSAATSSTTTTTTTPTTTTTTTTTPTTTTTTTTTPTTTITSTTTITTSTPTTTTTTPTTPITTTTSTTTTGATPTPTSGTTSDSTSPSPLQLGTLLVFGVGAVVVLIVALVLILPRKAR
ncbi:MAG: ABC transporter substrate-binding protein [Candidatus Hodarchaeota archaeon]